MRRRLIRWLTVLAAGWAGLGPSLAIVGPSQDGGDLASSIVMVLSRQGRVAGFCSAVVVAQEAVLTAAHCVAPGATVAVHYREGGSPVFLDIAAVARHPGFHADAIQTRQRSVDLALVRLARPLPARFHPAVLGDEPLPASLGTPYRLAGFGLRHEGEAGSSGILRTTDVAAQDPLSSLLLWAHDPSGRGGGACTGDSGGPVLRKDGTVVAIMAWSAGAGKLQCGALTQAVWIGPQHHWIDGVLSGWTSSP